jgi:ankyrin repeat protein
VFTTELAYYEDRAQGLVSAWQARVPPALDQIRDWHPAFAEASVEAVLEGPFDLEAARLVYARQHGFATWTELSRGLDDLARGTRIEPFLEAFEALRGRRWERLHELISRQPELLRARGTNGNTLLNLAVSLAGGICGPLSAEALSLFRLFLDRGADANEANDRGWTPLHQAAYAGRVELVRLLLEAGAAPDLEAHGEGGTPLAVALFWGNREAADALAERAIVPGNLRIAAGLGRLDLVDECFAADGALTTAARAQRGFYRPHSGFPLWRPSSARQEVLDEALVWAAKADRVAVLPALVARGADKNGDPYRGTPLLWAAAKCRLATATWLLDHGAEIDRRATFGGPAHGEGVTALHLAAQSDHVPMLRLLLARGADPTIEDRLYRSTPAGWAKHAGSKGALELLAR